MTPRHPVKSSEMPGAGRSGGLRESAPPTRTPPCALRAAPTATLPCRGWKRTSQDPVRRSEIGQSSRVSHLATRMAARFGEGGDPDREAARAAGSPRSAALLRTLAIRLGASAASRATPAADRPALPRHQSPLPVLQPHRSQPAWLSQARATLGSAHRPAQQEPSQSSGARGARGAAESPPPLTSRPISGRRGGSASRAAPASAAPPARAPRPPWLQLKVPRAPKTPRKLTGDRGLELVPTAKCQVSERDLCYSP